MNKPIQNKISESVKFKVLLSFFLLFLYKLFKVSRTSSFFGIDFRIISLVIILLLIISFISDLKDMKWIDKMLKKLFR